MSYNDTIGIDIGGANTKVASASGDARSFYLPLWKDCDLVQLLQFINDEFQPSNVGIVMTGELTDVFKSKSEGVLYIASCVHSVFASPYFFTVRGQFAQTVSKRNNALYAASNWAASSAFLAQGLSDCLFVDAGSTTCDIIPIKGGQAVASLTDFERLHANELIYTGVLRTNIATVLRSVTLGRRRYRLSSECYAITADAHRVLGNIEEAEYACDTPDSRQRDIDGCCRRIARVLLSDVETLGKRNIYQIARFVERAQVDELADALAVHADEQGIRQVVGAGLGEFIIERAASRQGLGCCLLSHQYGKVISQVFPAYAASRLLEQAIKR